MSLFSLFLAYQYTNQIKVTDQEEQPNNTHIFNIPWVGTAKIWQDNDATSQLFHLFYLGPKLV